MGAYTRALGENASHVRRGLREVGVETECPHEQVPAAERDRDGRRDRGGGDRDPEPRAGDGDRRRTHGQVRAVAGPRGGEPPRKAHTDVADQGERGGGCAQCPGALDLPGGLGLHHRHAQARGASHVFAEHGAHDRGGRGDRKAGHEWWVVRR